jgi:beta-glucanase (GH16 family)
MREAAVRFEKLLGSTLALACAFFISTGGARAQMQSSWASGCSGVANSKVGTITWTPVLCQEFNGPQGPPDTSAWSFDLGDDGWGNNEVEIYCGPANYPNNPAQCPASFSTDTANSYIDGKGHLLIQVISSGGNWYSARLKTEGTQNFQYGRIEASLQIPDTSNPGLWPAFWFLGSDIAMGTPWPLCGEADIMENWPPSVDNGPGPTHNKSTIHTALTGGSGFGSIYSFPSGQQADTTFYAYGVIWSANMLQFYVNPTTTPPAPVRPFFIVTTSDLQPGDTWPFNDSVFLLANVAVGGNLGGSTVNTPSSDLMMIDYVRQYTPSAVPAPVLGNPPSITVQAGATTGNTSTFTPVLMGGTGYVYFSCATNAPQASCSINSTDPLNRFVVDSGASSPESITVTVTTTSNAWLPPYGFAPRMRRLMLAGVLALLVCALLLIVRRRRRGGRLGYEVALAGLVLMGALLLACGDGAATPAPSIPAGSANNGTTPGGYTVTVYAFTESNASDGANGHADSSATIPLTVN